MQKEIKRVALLGTLVQGYRVVQTLVLVHEMRVISAANSAFSRQIWLFLNMAKYRINLRIVGGGKYGSLQLK